MSIDAASVLDNVDGGQTPRNIVELMLRTARDHPETGVRYCPADADAPSFLQRYPELLEAASRLLTGLRAQGMRQGDKVVLLVERPQEFIPAFWGCVLGGLVPCPLSPLRGDPERWAAQLAHVNQLLDKPLLLTSEVLAAEIPHVPGLTVTALERLRGHEPARELYAAEPDELALLVLTSGSTGNSKAVMLSHANLLASMAGKNGFHQLTAAGTTLNWVSFDHVAALLECHLLPLYCGALQVHVESRTVVNQPMEFLRLLSSHRVTMTFAPNFLLGLVNAAVSRLGANPAEACETAGQWDLSHLRQIISGGEAVVCTTGRTFLDNLAPYGLPSSALCPAFGMTETCAGSVYSAGFPELDEGREFANLGLPVSGLAIRVAGEHDQPLTAGEVGELQLAGPMITTGYYNDSQATADAFTPDGWFRSGDLGRIDDGRLTLVGRRKESVVVNGVTYYSHDIETAIEKLDGVATSYVAAFATRAKGADTEHLAVAFHAEIPMDDEAGMLRLVTAIHDTVVKHWGFRPSRILPLPASAFPKTSLGKIQRSLMRERLEAGAFDAAAEAVQRITLRRFDGCAAPENDTEWLLAEIFAEIFDTTADRISANASFFELGGSSLDLLRLRARVTRRLEVDDLQIGALLSAPTIRALAARIAEERSPSDRTSARRPYDPVVPMQVSGHKTPLFCVHPGCGEVLVLVNLARYFAADRPFYALRARGFNRGEEPFATFTEMVGTYVDAIRARQPHGPYAIAGYALGGSIAFEIAKALESQGERVDFVGSFNRPPFRSKNHAGERDFIRTAAELAFTLGLVTWEQSVDLPVRLRGLAREEQLRHILDVASADRRAVLDLTAEKLGAWADIAGRVIGLDRDYQPSGTVRSMKVFYAFPPLGGTKEDWLENELRRWDEFTVEANDYIELPGGHFTLMGQHVTAFQAILRRELDRAMGDG